MQPLNLNMYNGSYKKNIGVTIIKLAMDFQLIAKIITITTREIRLEQHSKLAWFEIHSHDFCWQTCWFSGLSCLPLLFTTSAERRLRIGDMCDVAFAHSRHLRRSPRSLNHRSDLDHHFLIPKITQQAVHSTKVILQPTHQCTIIEPTLSFLRSSEHIFHPCVIDIHRGV